MKSKWLRVWLFGPSHAYHAFPHNQVNKTNSEICAKCKSLQICHGKTGTHLFKDDFFIVYVFMPVCVFIWVWARVQVSMGAQRGIRSPGGGTDYCKPNHPLSVLGTKLLSSARTASHLFGPGTHLFKTSFSNPLSWPEIHQSWTKDYGGLYCLLASSVLNRARSQPLSSVYKVLYKHSQSIHTGPISLCPITTKSQGSPLLPTGTPVPSCLSAFSDAALPIFTSPFHCSRWPLVPKVHLSDQCGSVTIQADEQHTVLTNHHQQFRGRIIIIIPSNIWKLSMSFES